MEKLVIVINGSGGVGKDTLCGIAANYYKTMNISSVDPIKKIALENGWDGEKSPKARKFLSDLKQLFIEFNDLPLNYLMERHREFLESDSEILFVHIREPGEIAKFKESLNGACVTLLIKGWNDMEQNWHNTADDDVGNYRYDYCYVNNKDFGEVEKDFLAFFDRILKNA